MGGQWSKIIFPPEDGFFLLDTVPGGQCPVPDFPASDRYRLRKMSLCAGRWWRPCKGCSRTPPRPGMLVPSLLVAIRIHRVFVFECMCACARLLFNKPEPRNLCYGVPSQSTHLLGGCQMTDACPSPLKWPMPSSLEPVPSPAGDILWQWPP